MAKQEATLLDLGSTHGSTGAVPVGTTMSRNSCGICSGKVDFKTSAALQEHLEKVHFYCGSCRWFAESAELLGQHNELIHHMCAASAKIVSNGGGICGVRPFPFYPVFIDLYLPKNPAFMSLFTY